MGQYKRMMEEQEANGRDFTGLYVSSKCFKDANLRATLVSLCESGICSYTNENGDVVPMNTLRNYLRSYVFRYFDDPENCDLPLANGFIEKDDEDDENSPFDSIGSLLIYKDTKKFDSTEELLEEVNLLTKWDNLNTDLVDVFGEHQWVEREPFVISLREELSMKWKQFSDNVMHRQRFTFLANDEFNGKPEETDNGLFDILTEVGSIISEHGLCREILEDTVIYRVRPLKKRVEHKFDEITCPPDIVAKQNRMSPAGISMFYGGFDKKIALLEGSEKGDGKGWFLTGEFKPKRPLKVLDLTALPQNITFWLEGFEELAFLRSFHDEITRHIERDDRIHVEYVPSQVFTEYLRFIFKETPLDGMIYNSSLSEGKNVVLFCNQEESRNLLEVVRIDEINNRCCLKSLLCK